MFIKLHSFVMTPNAQIFMKYTRVLISPQPDQEGNKLQRQKVLSFTDPIYNHNCRNILLQSALQPLWVLACSTIVEYSQQEGFYRVPLPVARQTPNLEDQ